MAAPIEILTAPLPAETDPGDIDAYLAGGGYGAVRKALKSMSQAELIEEINASGIKGRGGAGFSTGMKWNLCADRFPRYLCANADESEP
ncbi:MAG: NADH-quinone oxidoreductase subunit F, partial [Gemmatimonadota bacterium]|nr:NADH-quinone oxidoreductase subunit F [Gemmatimonadota bacterium]